MSDKNIIYLNDSIIKQILTWDTLILAIENMFNAVGNKDETDTAQPTRIVMQIPGRPESVLLCMPAFCGKERAFGCKVVSSFPKNLDKGIPALNGIIILLDSETGILKMILDAKEITAWRTAAVTVVATKYMHKGEKKVLAILGAGVQGRSHALAMYNCFKFSQVRIWNRTYERAKTLCAELGDWAVPFENAEMCVRGADVIVTVTFTKEPIVEAEWLQTGAHINAIGGTRRHYEPAVDVYKRATIVVELLELKQEHQGIYAMGVEPFCELGDLTRGTRKLPDTKQFTIFQSMAIGGTRRHYEPAVDVYKRATIVVELLELKQEHQGIYAMGVEPFCELGDLTRGTRKLPDTKQFTIFQSMGMGLEDIATAELIYNQFMKNK